MWEDGRGSASGPQPQALPPEELNSSSLAVVRSPVPRRLQQLFVWGPDRPRKGKGVMEGNSPRAPLESEAPVPQVCVWRGHQQDQGWEVHLEEGAGSPGDMEHGEGRVRIPFLGGESLTPASPSFQKIPQS